LDPATGRLLGVLDVSGPLDTLSTDTLRMVRCAGRVAEGLLGTSDRGAVVSASPLGLRPTSPARRPVAEMFRSGRCKAMPWSRPPYRFIASLTGRSDAGRVLWLLHEGRVAGALEAYTARLLSRSGTLAVQLRDQLELAVGSAVRSSGDAGLLVQWLSTDTGSADAEAVQVLGCLVGHHDARYVAFRAGMSDTGRELLVYLRRRSGVKPLAQKAKLVALWVSQDVPQLAACLPDVGRARPKGKQAFQLGVLVPVHRVDVDEVAAIAP
jgi:hypothetical protein